MNSPKPPKPPNQEPKKQSPDQETNTYGPNPFPTDGEGISPYSLKYLIDIFIEPQQFFSGEAALGQPLYLLIAVWLAGLSYCFYSIEQNLLATDRGIDLSASIVETLDAIVAAWPSFWMRSLISSLLCGLMLWIIGAWWFRVRIQLSGDLNPNPRLAKVVYFYSLLVKSLPHILLVVIWTVMYPSYKAAFSEGKMLVTLLTAAFGFGELFTAYVGVKTLFTVSKTGAQVWFVALPAAFYAFGLAALLSGLSGP